MKGRCSRESPEGHDTAHCALGSIYASVAVPFRFLGCNVPRPFAFEFAPCNRAQLTRCKCWSVKVVSGPGVCEVSDCRRSWFACEARGVRGCAGGSGSSSSRLCPSASTWHQLSRMQGCLPFLREKKKKRIGLRREVAVPRSQAPDPTAQPSIILARMQTGRHCARVSAALLSILSLSLIHI